MLAADVLTEQQTAWWNVEDPWQVPTVAYNTQQA